MRRFTVTPTQGFGAVLPRGARVRTLRSGLYTNAGEEARWFLVDAGAGREGWVHGGYLALDR